MWSLWSLEWLAIVYIGRLYRSHVASHSPTLSLYRIRRNEILYATSTWCASHLRCIRGQGQSSPIIFGPYIFVRRNWQLLKTSSQFSNCQIETNNYWSYDGPVAVHGSGEKWSFLPWFLWNLATNTSVFISLLRAGGGRKGRCRVGASYASEKLQTLALQNEQLAW
jgi:hypothetical protein